MNDPCLSRDEIQSFRSPDISADARMRIAKHLEICGHCRQALKAIAGPATAQGSKTRPVSPANHKVAVQAKANVAQGSALEPTKPAVPQGDSVDPTAVQPSSFINPGNLNSVLGPPLQPGDLGSIDRYRVLKELGHGGMGVVYKAIEPELQRDVALKVMLPTMDNTSRERFIREAKAMASISSDHVVSVYQVGHYNGLPFLSMELLKGANLGEWLKLGKRMGFRPLLRLAREIAEGLAAAQEKGLIHRDIKPANLWIETPSGRVKILDFGLARGNEDTHLTQTGYVVGTPQFMSPEQAENVEPDQRCDLFSMGCVLYRVATGELPFDGPSVIAVMKQVAMHDPPPVNERNPDIPESLSDLIMDLLAKRREDRPASAREVIEHIKQIEKSPKRTSGNGKTEIIQIKRRRPRETPYYQTTAFKAAVALAGVLVIGFLCFHFIRKSASSHPPESSEQARFKPPAETRPETKGKPAPGPGKKGEPPPKKGNPPPPPKKEPPIVEPPPKKEPPPPLKNDPPPKKDPPPPMKKVFLSTLRPVNKSNWPHGPLESRKVVVMGKPSPHGVGMHPPPHFVGFAGVQYRLGKRFRVFSSQVGLNDSSPPTIGSPVTFFVYGDKKLLWQSKPITDRKLIQDCMVEVKEVDQLTIYTKCKGDPKGAHAVWIEPYLE